MSWLVDLFSDIRPILLANHVLGFISWMAGLLYLIRLFIYHVENNHDTTRTKQEKKKFSDQFVVMQKRLYWYIAFPAMVFTFINGLPLAYVSQVHKETWFITKFGLLLLMLHYHFKCSRIMLRLSAGEFHKSSKSLRVLNEVITVIMAGIVSLAIFKDVINAIIYFIFFIVLIFVLFMLAKIFGQKKTNSKIQKDNDQK